MEPVTTTVGTTLGLKLAQIVAGFAGGVVSLAFIQGLTRWQAIMAVVVGALTAGYLTPVVVIKLGFSPALENGTAFMLGLCAMNIIPVIKRLAIMRVTYVAGSSTPTSTKTGQDE